MGRSSFRSSYHRVLNINGLDYPTEKAIPKLVEQPGVCVETFSVSGSIPWYGAVRAFPRCGGNHFAWLV